MRLALAAVMLLALAWVLPLEATIAWGWDETMHAAGPSWRFATALSSGDLAGFFRALDACERYPFVFPLALGLEQLVFGISEHGARVFVTLVWCATILAVFLLARRAVAKESAGWIALLAAATSPLALSFAGTALLEVPSAAAVALALLAWIRRREEGLTANERRRRDLLAGVALALVFFTKFNYGLLLWAALALDELVQLALARGEPLGVRARSAAWTTLVPLVALAWWFLLPLPHGLASAAAHRAAFVDWIGGNQDLPQAPWTIRLLNAAAFLEPNPRALLLVLVGTLAALRELRRPAVRALALAALVLGAAILGHRYHLTRFLIPLGVPLWALAGVGWSRLLPVAPLRRGGAVAALALGCAILSGRDTQALADALGFLSDKPAVRTYQLEELATQRQLAGSRRLRSLGLKREEYERFFDTLAPQVAPTERIGWLDLAEEVSPAGLQYGLLRRGRDPRTFAAQLWDETGISIAGTDPAWTDEQLDLWAARFDVILFSEPHHLRGRAGREFFDGYAGRLEARGWSRTPIGMLAVERPLKEPLPVALFLLRRAP